MFDKISKPCPMLAFDLIPTPLDLRITKETSHVCDKRIPCLLGDVAKIIEVKNQRIMIYDHSNHH